MNENQIKAEAIQDFVDMMIGAYSDGFTEHNSPTLAQIHQAARNYISDNYDIVTLSIDAEWGDSVAMACGLK